MNARQVWLLIFILLVAAWLQASFANKLSIAHARPDFILVTAVCISIILGTIDSALYNIWAGFLTAVLAGINYGSIMLSRLATGCLGGLLRQHVIEDSVIVPPITIFIATWICSLLYFVMAPNLHTAKWWLHMVLLESLYNCGLSLPIYFILRRLHIGVSDNHGDAIIYSST
jgi:rod shape-determining protein MreD